MKKIVLALALLLSVPVCALAQSITVPATVNVETPGLVIIRSTAMDAEDVHWFSVTPGLQTFPSDVVVPKLGVYLGLAMKEGTYKVGVIPAKAVNGRAVIGVPQYVVVIVGKAPPGPDPKPDPKPDPPMPQPVAGLKVLILYESADLTKMPAAQQAILFNKSVRDYLNAKCPLGPDGKTREWRIWDKDTDVSATAKHWKDAMQRPRQQVPWIIVMDGAGLMRFEGPLPGNVADAMTLLKKHGGD